MSDRGLTKPDWKEAQRQVDTIAGEVGAEVMFQVFDDQGEDARQAEYRYGRLSDPEIRKWLQGKVKRRCGVFITVNRTDSVGRRRRNITHYLAAFIDLDGKALPATWPIEPDLVLESSAGRYHAYWMLEPGTDLIGWRDLQVRLAAYYDGDAKVVDEPRVMRLAGFDHQKAAPFRSRILRCVDPQEVLLGKFDRRSLQEIAEAHPCDYKKPTAPVEATSAAGDVEWDTEGALDRARLFMDGLEPPEAGSRNNTVYEIACKLNDMAISFEKSLELLQEWNGGLTNPLDDNELRQVVHSAPKYKQNPPGANAADKGKPRPKIVPTKFTFVPPENIPPREWIYKPYYLRKFLTLTTATSGVGKSRLVMAESVAMATGRALLNLEPVGPLNVWYWNGEDPRDEIERGFAAINLQFGLKREDIEGALFYDSGRILPIKIAESKNGATRIAEPVVREVIEAIRDHKIDVLTVDPFATTHSATENDNTAMEMVARQWAYIADETNCSIGIVHHTRKTGGFAGTIEDSRGGSALVAAVRVRRAVNKMTETQAKAAAIDPAKCGFHFSVSDANSNLTKPSSALEWYELKSVNLNNMSLIQSGDSIGVAVPFEYTALTQDLDLGDSERRIVLDAIKGGKWRDNARSDDWVGKPIAKALGLVLDGDSHKQDRARMRKLIADWLKDGTLVEYDDLDEHRKRKTFIKAL
jgi:hypothetical protein